ncbi:MAG: hypothetical protein V3W14_07325 [Candidatus Neomarinimicrobiota bacterium]
MTISIILIVLGTGITVWSIWSTRKKLNEYLKVRAEIRDRAGKIAVITANWEVFSIEVGEAILDHIDEYLKGGK